MAKNTKPVKTGSGIPKIDDTKQDLEEIKQLLEQMKTLLEKLLEVLPFKK